MSLEIKIVEREIALSEIVAERGRLILAMNQEIQDLRGQILELTKPEVSD